MAKETDVTSIRIPKSVKAELQDVALEKEPLHVTIQRLIQQNKAYQHERQSFVDTLEILTKVVNHQDAMLKELNNADNGVEDGL